MAADTLDTQTRVFATMALHAQMRLFAAEAFVVCINMQHSFTAHAIQWCC